MPDITDAFAEAAAPNAGAISNGRALVAGGNFTKLWRTDDGSLLFAHCQGSGKNPYTPSADFVNEASPVYRCSCPSRQFPCKHVVGLLFAAAGGGTFATAEIPADIRDKRDKAEKRATKKKTTKKKSGPKKVNKAAQSKKIRAQLDGLDLLESLTHDLLRRGLGHLNPKTARELEDQAKQLGDAYLPGAQHAVRALTHLFTDADRARSKKTDRFEPVYSDAIDRLTRIHAIIKRGRAYLNQRLSDPDLKHDTETDIAAWLGHAWTLEELDAHGRAREGASLIQLAFRCCDDATRQMFTDQGVWLDLDTGDLDCTLNFRPYKAARHIKEQDAVFEVTTPTKLYTYPGDLNRRIRWDGATTREVTPADCATIKTHAPATLTDAIKRVKQHLRLPLGHERPMLLAPVERVGTNGDEIVIEDKAGACIALRDHPEYDEHPTAGLLRALSREQLTRQVMLLRFHHDLDARRLTAKPVSVITDDQIIRLEF